MHGAGCGWAGMRGSPQNEERELLQRDKWNSSFENCHSSTSLKSGLKIRRAYGMLSSIAKVI